MNTVKDVSRITGISIRTLRYYDEIGLLKPTACTPAGYRLYDGKALATLQEILFFKELEIPLVTIKKIITDPGYDREQALYAQRLFLERKRNHLNGIIALIDDVAKGVNTMNFEAFADSDIHAVITHSLALQDPETTQAIIETFGSLASYRAYFSKCLKDEKTNAHLIKLYGSKDKAVEAALHSTGNKEEIKKLQDENDEIYQKFALAMKTDDGALAAEAVEQLADNYKRMFRLDHARYLLLNVAEDYLHSSPLTEATEKQYGPGITHYIAQAIQHYFGA